MILPTRRVPCALNGRRLTSTSAEQPFWNWSKEEQLPQAIRKRDMAL